MHCEKCIVSSRVWCTAHFHRRGSQASPNDTMQHTIKEAEVFFSLFPYANLCRLHSPVWAEHWLGDAQPTVDATAGSCPKFLKAPVGQGPFSGVLPSAQQNLNPAWLDGVFSITGLWEAFSFSPRPDSQKLKATEGELSNHSPRMKTHSPGKNLQVSFTCPLWWWQ